MATKKVLITSKPKKQDADAWVEKREAPTMAAEVLDIVPMKRLTIDIPAKLHFALKLHCLNNGTTIAEVARELFSQYCDIDSKSK